MSATFSETAPAKLNLCLYVGDKRADGLHELVSLFLPLTLADRLLATVIDAGEDQLVCPGVERDNLVARALAAFRDRFAPELPKLRIEIDKQIPIAAGLGGGSADAAAALRIAQRISGRIPAPDELGALAMSIGADVPSQLDPRLQLVSGAGERFEPLERSLQMNGVLLTYEDGLSTADVYMHADSMFPPRSGLDQLAATVRASVVAADGDALELRDLIHNDLQGSAVALEPLIGDGLDLLRESGAKAALVTGSGPTTFGLFESPQQASVAIERISARWRGNVLPIVSAA